MEKETKFNDRGQRFEAFFFPRFQSIGNLFDFCQIYKVVNTTLSTCFNLLNISTSYTFLCKHFFCKHSPKSSILQFEFFLKIIWKKLQVFWGTFGYLAPYNKNWLIYKWIDLLTYLVNDLCQTTLNTHLIKMTFKTYEFRRRIYFCNCTSVHDHNPEKRN